MNKLDANNGVYKILNLINKKFYIGSTSDIDGFRARWSEHKYQLKHNKHHNQYLQNAWNKYREEKFEFQIICFSDPDKCLFFEQKCLDKYRPFYDTENGYNIAKDAKSPMKNKKHSAESKEKMRNYFNNNPKTELHKQNIRLALGSENTKKRMKKIIRIDLQTNDIKKYNCINDARRDGFSQSSIIYCCQGKYLSHKGFIWKYDNE